MTMKHGSVFAFAVLVAFAGVAWVPHTIVDNMQPVNLPELMKAFDGSDVKTVADWDGKRRPEILDFFTRNMHGIRPVDRPDGLAFTPLAPDAELKDGTIIRKQTRISFNGPRGSWGFNVLAFLPKSAKPVPAFVLICNRVLEKNVDPELKVVSEFCPAEAIARRGYALVVFKNTELALDEYYPYIENGKVVDFGAKERQDALAQLLSFDEGSAYLGEVALVPYDSPISQSGILFFNTLYDENAACHLAFGRPYPENLRGGKDMSGEELAALGANESMQHIDFMIGTRGTDIDGIQADGTVVPVFRNGNWAEGC